IQVDWRAWCHRLVRVRERCRSKWSPAPEPPPHSNSPLCLCGLCPRQAWELPHQCLWLRECRHLRLGDRTVEIQIFQSAVSLKKICARTIGHSRAGLDRTDEGVCPYTGPRVKDPSPSELAGEGARATQFDSHNPIHFFSH